MRRLQLAGIAAVLLGLPACSPGNLGAANYPDRVQFQFRNASGTEIYSYACVWAGSQGETQARVARAHQMVDAGIRSINTRYTGQAETSQNPFDVSLENRSAINRDISALARRADSEHRCRLFNRQGA